MKMRFVWTGLLAASVVALATGTGYSGPTPTSTTDNQLASFNAATSELSAYPTGLGLTTYLHRSTTVHLPAILVGFTPPDPCLPLAQAWNLTVEYDTAHRATSTFLFEALLGLMSDFSCRATVTSPTTGAPLPIVYITPIAN